MPSHTLEEKKRKRKETRGGEEKNRKQMRTKDNVRAEAAGAGTKYIDKNKKQIYVLTVTAGEKEKELNRRGGKIFFIKIVNRG